MDSFDKKGKDETVEMRIKNSTNRDVEREEEVISKLSDKKLLSKYFSLQRDTQRGIDIRNRERTDLEKQYDRNAGLKDDFRQVQVEESFSDVGKLRAEIDKRGLEAPTMEEIEKMSSEEINKLIKSF